jgi:PAS domain S-box-containing protein
MTDKHKLSILYVEDENESLAATTKMISRRVEEVYFADNTIEGIKLFKKYFPDIVILNISKPGMDALEMLEELNKVNDNNKSIIISENTEILYFKKSVKQGVNDFIVKPVKKEKLFLAINKLANIIKLEKQVKQQQLTIKNNEQNYRAIYNNLSHSVAILDINTYKIIDANTKTCEEFGYSYNNLLGKKIEELSKGEHPYTEEEAINHIQKCLIKQQHIFEWRAKRKNGSIVWCEISIKKIDINGTERILFIANNIEKRKQEELKSNVNEAKYFNLYDTANDAILLIHLMGNHLKLKLLKK